MRPARAWCPLPRAPRCAHFCQTTFSRANPLTSCAPRAAPNFLPQKAQFLMAAAHGLLALAGGAAPGPPPPPRGPGRPRSAERGQAGRNARGEARIVVQRRAEEAAAGAAWAEDHAWALERLTELRGKRGRGEPVTKDQKLLAISALSCTMRAASCALPRRRAASRRAQTRARSCPAGPSTP